MEQRMADEELRPSNAPQRSDDSIPFSKDLPREGKLSDPPPRFR
jgi:hypothetical protein